jgi:hypothetical protein
MKSEKELRAAYEKYQREAHPEDRMSYVEYLLAMGIEVKYEDDNWYGEEDDWYK